MNVICLGLFSVLIVRNLLYPDLQEMLMYSYMIMVYLMVDIVWLFKWPECNPCPKETILHHFISIFALFIAITVPESRYIGAKVQLIELTTWLSHLRRLLKRKSYRVLNGFFYVFLLVIRHLWFPYLAYWLLLRWSEALYIKLCLSGVLYVKHYVHQVDNTTIKGNNAEQR